MRRIERDGRIVYVERRRALSFALLALGVGSLAASAFPGLTDPQSLLMMGASFALGAFLVLLLERAWIIDAFAGTLKTVDRSLFGGRRRDYPLKAHRVRVTSDPAGRLGWIWLEFPGRGRVLFEGAVRLERVRERVERLRADLGG